MSLELTHPGGQGGRSPLSEADRGVLPSLAAPVVARRRLAPAAVCRAGLLLGALFLIVMGTLGAIFGLRPLFSGGYHPSQMARADIPAQYLQLYVAVGRRYGVDPWILAGIGSVETDHGRSPAPGVHIRSQRVRLLRGPDAVLGRRVAEHLGSLRHRRQRRRPSRRSTTRADAIPAAARYLRAAGAPDDYHAALFAYNHAEWYVAQVLAKAAAYRGSATVAGDTPELGSGVLRDVLHNPRISLTPIQQSDLRSGAIDPRLIATLAWVSRHHFVVVTALKSDHSRYTVDGARLQPRRRPRDGHRCGRRRDLSAPAPAACADLVRELAAVTARFARRELIYCWDPDGPNDSRGFARADHCDPTSTWGSTDDGRAPLLPVVHPGLHDSRHHRPPCLARRD